MTEQKDSRKAEPSLTVVISTADRVRLVFDCVKALGDAGAPSEVEVIVVDASAGASIKPDELHAAWRNSRVIPFPEKNMAKQRNEGIRQARSEIVCFIDDDCYVQPGWWPAILAPFQDQSVGAVAGAVWCNPHPKLTGARGGYVNLCGVPIQVTHRGKDAPREVDWPVGANMAFRKSAALALGGLAEVYGIYDEDVDFGLRLRKAGWKIVFQPDAAVYHYFRERPRKPATRHTAFASGRNRSVLLVRNYGLSIRLLLFFITAPVIRVLSATWKALRGAATHYCHAAAYVAGMLNGIIVGIRNPVSGDADRFYGKPRIECPEPDKD